MSIDNLRILANTTFEDYPDMSVEKFIRDAIVEYDKLSDTEVDLRNALKAANNHNSKLLDDNKLLKGRINEAVSCVHNSHEDDMGYDVLCSLGENP